MIQRILLSCLAALACAAVPLPAPAPVPLPAQTQRGVGQKAPKLVDVQWLRGRPVSQYKRGTAYVLYFWSTSAPKCWRSAPMMEQLRTTHEGQRVELIGISIWQRPDAVPVDALLEKRGAALGSPQARDVLDKTATAWHALVGLSSVPFVVLIDRDGTVAWSGHPFDGVDVALRAVLDGDEQALADLVARRTGLHEQAATLMEDIRKSWRTKRWDKVPAQVDELIALDERFYATWIEWKYQALIHGGQAEEAAAYGRQVLDADRLPCEATLNEMAWFIVDPRGKVQGDARDVELALRMASRANELSGGRDASILDTLARARFLGGDVAGAIEAEELAAKEAYGSDMRAAMEKTLAEYRLGTGTAGSP